MKVKFSSKEFPSAVSENLPTVESKEHDDSRERRIRVKKKFRTVCCPILIALMLASSAFVLMVVAVNYPWTSCEPSITSIPEGFSLSDQITDSKVNPAASVASQSSIQWPSYRIVCYYVIPSNVSHQRELPPEAVDPYFCTHIIIGFSGVENGTIQPRSLDYLNVYQKVIGFKRVNPSLKVMLSVADMSSYGEFSRMVSTDQMRSKFVKDSIQFLLKLGFDGLDLDWEFPSWPNADLNQVKNFSLLLEEFRYYIDKEAKNLIFSAAVAAPDMIIRQSYEVDQLALHLDFVNIMCYDYHMFTDFTPMTGPNAPLYASPREKGYFRTLNTDWSASQWVSLGMPREKINVGIPTYGHSFKLLNEDNNGWNAPASGNGETGWQGFITYPDACRFIKNPDTLRLFDEDFQVPYAALGKEWLSYDNVMSVSFKASYVKERRFGGAMIFSLNSDDFYGECGQRKFVLTREVSDVLSKLT